MEHIEKNNHFIKAVMLIQNNINCELEIDSISRTVGIDSCHLTVMFTNRQKAYVDIDNATCTLIP